MKNFLFSLLAFTLLAFVSPSFSAAESPDEAAGKTQLESKINTIIDLVNNKALSTEERRKSMRTVFDDVFNMEEMSKRCLVQNWKDASDQQRPEFVKVFADLIFSSYVKKIESYNNEKVVYNKAELLKENYLEVDTTVVGNKETYSLVYKMKKSGDAWKIYDVVIENVSFVNNYKSQFDDTLAKENLDGLIAQLKKTRDKIDAENTSAKASK